MHSITDPAGHLTPQAVFELLCKGRRLFLLRPGASLYLQGEYSNHLFYVVDGAVKVSHFSKRGKEVWIALLQCGSFAGEDALNSQRSFRTTSAIVVKDCSFLRIRPSEMITIMLQEAKLAEYMRVQLIKKLEAIELALIDQVSSSIQKRLARALIRLAQDTGNEPAGSFLPYVSQETLAAMIGCSRPRVNFYLNQFKRLGLVEYNGSIRVKPALRQLLASH